MVLLAGSLDLRHTLGPLQHGRHDPTTRVSRREVWRATRTPDGPGTLHLWWEAEALRHEAWGPGADWLVERIPRLVGAGDPPFDLPVPDEVVRRALAAAPGLRIGRCDTLLHALVPTILAQRVTAGEALTSWVELCRRLSPAAPGPAGLHLPPDPDDLAALPSWWFHPLGVERKRAETVIRCARRARGLERLIEPGAGRRRPSTGHHPWRRAVDDRLGHGPGLRRPRRGAGGRLPHPPLDLLGPRRSSLAAAISGCWSCWRPTPARGVG